MTDINVDIDFFNHPKTIRLTGLLGKDSEVLPIKLWCWCAKYHAETGKLSGYSANEIESAVNWRGTRGSMVNAMVQVGFMVDVGNGNYEIHDWLTKQGHIPALKERAKKGAVERWRRWREERDSNKDALNASNASSNATSIAKQCSTALPLLSVLTPPKAPPCWGGIASGSPGEGEKTEELIPKEELSELFKNLGGILKGDKTDAKFCNSSEKVATN